MPFCEIAIDDSALGLSTPTFSEFTREAAGGGSEHHQPLSARDDLGTNCKANTRAFNQALQAAQPGDTIQVPDGSSFHFTGGIIARDLNRITIDIAGSMHFVHDQQVSVV